MITPAIDRPVIQNTAIILGSARSNGNTFKAVEKVKEKLSTPLFFDLAHYNISDFNYDSENQSDDFMCLIEQVLSCSTILFATPVYWYTMSTPMKRFVDRLTDLLSIEKDIGRMLRGKNLAVISSYSIHPEGKDGFEPIFINTAKYLGMHYLGCYFHYAGDDETIMGHNPTSLTKFLEGLSRGISHEK